MKISCALKAMKPPLCSMTRVYSTSGQSQGNTGITFWQIAMEWGASLKMTAKTNF